MYWLYRVIRQSLSKIPPRLAVPSAPPRKIRGSPRGGARHPQTTTQGRHNAQNQRQSTRGARHPQTTTQGRHNAQNQRQPTRGRQPPTNHNPRQTQRAKSEAAHAGAPATHKPQPKGRHNAQNQRQPTPGRPPPTDHNPNQTQRAISATASDWAPIHRPQPPVPRKSRTPHAIAITCPIDPATQNGYVSRFPPDALQKPRPHGRPRDQSVPET